jgi:hypothetical protein
VGLCLSRVVWLMGCGFASDAEDGGLRQCNGLRDRLTPRFRCGRGVVETARLQGTRRGKTTCGGDASGRD